MTRLSTILLLWVVASATAFAPREAKVPRRNVQRALFSDIAAAVADPKKAIAKALAGNYDEAAVKAKVESLIDETPVLLFSFTTCPFCLKAKEVLDSKNAKYTVVELNQVPDGSGMRVEMANIIGRTSVPALFVQKEFLGGFNDGGKGGVDKLDKSGELDTLLRAAGALP